MDSTTHDHDISDTLLALFRQVAPPAQVVAATRAAHGGKLTPDAQRLLVLRVFADPVAVRYPPDKAYKGRLVRVLADAAARDNQETTDELACCLVDTLLEAFPHPADAAPRSDGGHDGDGGDDVMAGASNGGGDVLAGAGWCFKTYKYATWSCSGSSGGGTASSGRTPTVAGKMPAPCDAACNSGGGCGGCGGGLEEEGEREGRSGSGEEEKEGESGGCGGDDKDEGEGEGCGGGEVAGVGGSGGLVTLRVSHNLFEGSTGCHEWEAGFRLAELVLSHRGAFQGRACLELGCGSGMVGVALSRVGASHVWLTDGDAQTVNNCAANLRINGVRAVPLARPPPRRQRPPDPAGGERGLEEDEGPRPEAAPAAAAAGPGAAPAVGDGLNGASRLRQCAQRDPAAAAAECGVLRWEEGWAAGRPPPEVVLAADVLYDPDVIPDLVALLTSLLTLTPPPPKALAASAPRQTVFSPPQRQQPPMQPASRPTAAAAAATASTEAPSSASPLTGPPAARACGGGPGSSGAECSSSSSGCLGGDLGDDVGGGGWSYPCAVVCTTLRNERTLALFLSEASAAGLRVRELPPWDDIHDADGARGGGRGSGGGGGGDDIGDPSGARGGGGGSGGTSGRLLSMTGPPQEDEARGAQRHQQMWQQQRRQRRVVRFVRHLALEGSRDRIKVHVLTSASS